MAVRIVERSAGSAAVVERTPTTVLDILRSAVLWLDASLSEITTEGEPT